MSEQVFLFLEGMCLGIVTGSGLCLWVMWKDKIAMTREYDRQIEDMERQVEDAMAEVKKIIERGKKCP